MTGDLLPRLRSDPQISRFSRHRSEDNLQRSKQLLIEFLCSNAGGPVYCAGRDMKTSHKRMGISDSDWSVFMGHILATLEDFQVPQAERDEVVALIEGAKQDMVVAA